jgi:tRNA G18 (ribose-2'-O)-methylase SpoU
MSGVLFTTLYQGSREEILRVLADTPIVIADMGGENAFCFDAPKQFALVIGNEANGVSSIIEEKAAYTVKIPMAVFKIHVSTLVISLV